MRCYFCNHEDTKVVDSRASLEGNSIKRRRECSNCKKRFTTFEKVEATQLYVVKKDNRRVKFDNEKLMRGLTAASIKRDISRDDLEKLVFEIEKTIENSLKNEISSKELGDLVLSKLKQIDQVAYVRFASVYKQFDDIKSFIELAEELYREDK